MNSHSRPEKYSIAGVPVIISNDPGTLSQAWEDADRHVCLICDENTARHCLPKMPFLSEAAHATIIIPPGEQNKTLDTCKHVWKTLAEHRADRGSLIINLGGGVVTDLGGFCAATYMRGVDFIHIPTSLLAMCDAALGGKHGVDFEGLKNYIGLVKQPLSIWINPTFLDTLPARQLRNGMAEIVKHALIGEGGLYEFLDGATATTITDWTSVLQKSIRIKEEFVKDDVHEHGNRAALNFGHTFGHALESYFLNDKEPLLHGECVALGMIIETWLGHLHLGVPPRATCRGITGMINKQVPVDVPRKVRMQELLPVLRQDKKQRGGSIRFTFIRKIGDPVVDQEVDEEVFDALLEDNEITLLLPWLMK